MYQKICGLKTKGNHMVCGSNSVASAKPAQSFDDRLKNIDLRPIGTYLCKRQKMSPRKASRAEFQYRAFLRNVNLVGFRQGCRPSRLADQMWHAHILHTKKYAVDCRKLFGRFLHHQPEPVLKKRPNAECEPSLDRRVCSDCASGNE